MLVDFQDAKLIESKIKEKGVVLYTENIDNIFGTHYIKYLYSDNKTKEIHIDTMLENKWRYDKPSQSNESIFVDWYRNDKNDIYLPCAIFSKKIKNIFKD